MTVPDDTIESDVPRIAIVLVFKAAIASAGDLEAERFAEIARALSKGRDIFIAFTEQATPSLRGVIEDLCRRDFAEIHLVPLIIPHEASFSVWVSGAISRWLREAPGKAPPVVRIAPGVAECRSMASLLSDLMAGAASAPAVSEVPEKENSGSVVSTAANRVLVCDGRPCHEAGASAVWVHLRAEQARLDLRKIAGGTMTARTTCLGPCKLAPVVQVWPQGTVYGGVDERAVDRIIAEHILQNAPVADLSYAPGPGKQRLRDRGRLLG